MECIEGVDGSRDAVEADAFESNLADKLGILDGGIGIFGRRDAVQNGKRVGRVEGKCSSGLNCQYCSIELMFVIIPKLSTKTLGRGS
jgi:hypothetical protein